MSGGRLRWAQVLLRYHLEACLGGLLVPPHKPCCRTDTTTGGAHCGNIGYSDSNGTMRAKAPTPAIAPEGVPQASSRIRRITDPVGLGRLLFRLENQTAMLVVWYYYNKVDPLPPSPPPIECCVSPRQAIHGVHRLGRRGEGFVQPRKKLKKIAESGDIRRTSAARAPHRGQGLSSQRDVSRNTVTSANCGTCGNVRDERLFCRTCTDTRIPIIVDHSLVRRPIGWYMHVSCYGMTRMYDHSKLCTSVEPHDYQWLVLLYVWYKFSPLCLRNLKYYVFSSRQTFCPVSREE